MHNKGGCPVPLRDWTTKRFRYGDNEFQLDKKGMEHILKRHHPKYWDGSVKKEQSFLDPKLSVDDLKHVVGEVMNQNRVTLLQNGIKHKYQVTGTVNGVKYTLGMKKGGRVGQLYPVYE
ncbi:hypothetical protein [Streptomyces sp. Ac-502]|uniref:hypothetical protein n=1 Tax=Streptomyces sp. Ac-502 TaxID=3342801 RepID=UPI003862A650